MNNNSMVITRGIPASGKSTFARRWVAEDPDNRIEVNRDQVRLMIGAGQIGDEAQERSVSVICDEMIHAGLRAGKSVVVSNTHLRLSDLLDAITIGLRYLPRGAITIQDFRIDVDEAIRRNEGREDEVPESVIARMAEQYPSDRWATHADLMRIIDSRGRSRRRRQSLTVTP